MTRIRTQKRWVLAPQLSLRERSQFREMHPLIAQVLYNRGLTDYESALDFLKGRSTLHDPMRMKGMQQAIGRIRQAIRAREPIVVYGDFDADGVTSTVLLVQTLRGLGAIVKPYIPDRVDEGYGLNTPALLGLAAEGNKLIITVDCGTRSVEEVVAAQEVGLDIIITDHHSVGDDIPPALAVLNPKQADCKYPEDMLAGVGIAFKLAEGLIRVAKANDRSAPNITVEELLDLVALGTVADLAPLDRAENRTLVIAGLQQLNRAKRPGIYALLNVANVEPGKADATSIGFSLGPRINAAGRLGSAMTAYELLDTDNINRAMDLATQLQEINTRRQELTQRLQEEARSMALAEANGDLPLIFASAPHFTSGVVGLVAGRLVEEFYRPAIVVEQGEEESRGSCRSIEEFNITEALDQCADLLLRHGGHAQAAGFSILTENIPAFKQRLMNLARAQLVGQVLEPAVHIDAKMSLSQATLELARELEQLQPTGHANHSPVFMSERVRVLDYRAVGRDGKHLKLKLGDGPVHIDGIAFGQGDWSSDMPPYVDVAFHLEVNEWQGFIKPQVNVQDIRVAQ
ncbi:MAG: single-stranded-DNA-specific exonuclease RecJ [Anaerolineales bacterium]